MECSYLAYLDRQQTTITNALRLRAANETIRQGFVNHKGPFSANTPLPDHNTIAVAAFKITAIIASTSAELSSRARRSNIARATSTVTIHPSGGATMNASIINIKRVSILEALSTLYDGDRSGIRRIKNLLQSRRQFRWKLRQPRCVDQSNTDQVTDVGSILVAVLHQLHFNQGFQQDDTEVRRIINSLHFGRRQQMVWTGFLARKKEVNGLTRLALSAVPKHYDIHQFVVYESSFLHRSRYRRQIATPNENVDIARRANCTFIDRCNPRRDSVAADDSVWDAECVQHAGRAQQPFAHLGHGSLHAVEDVHAHADGPGRPRLHTFRA